MASLRFYGGVNEIGGNKILLEHKESRLWFDFGKSFTQGEGYYVNWLKPRNNLRDYFEFNLLPEIQGLYSERMLKGSHLSYEEPGFQGVFITHAHADHVNHISFLDASIPIFTGKGTKLFMEAMEKTSSFANYGKHDYRGFRTGDTVKIDDLEIEPIHVDHSIPAAYGYIVHAPEGSIVYTGDMRSHGTRAEMTQEFLESAAYAEPVAMICEGTRMLRRGKRKHLTEPQVEAGVKKVCEEADMDKKSVLYTHPGRDMDRLRTFYRAAESCGRVMVISPRTAHLLDRLIEDEHLDLPDPHSDDLVSVYYRKKKSGTYVEKDYFVWERPYLDKIVTAEELSQRPTDYLISLDFYNFTELIDIRPEKGSHYIYSMSEPFSDEDLEEEVLHNWLGHFGLKYHQLHASGHMSPKELGEAIEQVNPKTLYPVHTEDPERFKKIMENTVSPVIGERYLV